MTLIEPNLVKNPLLGLLVNGLAPLHVMLKIELPVWELWQITDEPKIPGKNHHLLEDGEAVIF